MEMDRISPTSSTPSKDKKIEKQMSPNEEVASVEVVEAATHRGLKVRHTTMIALGGSVGTVSISPVDHEKQD
jgi:amino acid permease